jgi:hypothetical protein
MSLRPDHTSVNLCAVYLRMYIYILVCIYIYISIYILVYIYVNII